MHIFKYMYLNACVYSNILKLLCIYISKFELLLFTKHSLSGLGSSPRDAPGTVQLLAEPLMKAVVPFFGTELWNRNKSSMAKLETFQMIV